MLRANFKVSSSFFSILGFSILACSPASASDLMMATNFDGDSFGDLVLYSAPEGSFSVRRSSDSAELVIKADGSSAGDYPALGDFNGDGKADAATFNPSTGNFAVKLTDGGSSTVSFGTVGAYPVVGNYAGGSCSQYATFNKRTAQWKIADCNGQNATTVTFGDPGDIPMPMDFDGDGKTDKAVYDPVTSEWRISRSSDSVVDNFFFGLKGDTPTSGDYDGDGADEVAIYRRSTGTTFWSNSHTTGGLGNVGGVKQWGLNQDLFAQANVDGDNKPDWVVFRPSDRNFYIETSSGAVFFQVPVTSVTQVRTVPLSASNVDTPAWNNMNHRINALGDWNGDNRSDHVVAEVDRTNPSNSAVGTTTASVLHQNGAQSSYQIAVAGDALVPGTWNGGNRMQLGIVTVNVSTSDLEWRVLNHDGSVTTTIFGENGSSPLTGDLDCDGKTDRILTKVTSPFLYWTAQLSTGGSITNKMFGLEGDRPFTADLNGDGCDELGVSREIAGGVWWFWEDIANNNPTVNYEMWGLEDDFAPKPVDMDGDGRDDLQVVRDIGGGLYVFERYNESLQMMYQFGLAGDVSMNGRNTGGVTRNERMVWRPASNTSGTSLFYTDKFNSTVGVLGFGGRNNFVIRPDGTVAQPHPPSTEFACNPSPGTEGDFQDGGGGDLWKPVSESTGKVVILFDADLCDEENNGQLSVAILGSNGETVAGIASHHCNGANDGRPHYRVDKTASQLAAFAPITVKMNHPGIEECRVVPNPTQRYD